MDDGSPGGEGVGGGTGGSGDEETIRLEKVGWVEGLASAATK